MFYSHSEITRKEKAYKIKWLYECFGLSKQAYYQKIKAGKRKEMEAVAIKKMIEPIRKIMPKYGFRLYISFTASLKIIPTHSASPSEHLASYLGM